MNSKGSDGQIGNAPIYDMSIVLDDSRSNDRVADAMYAIVMTEKTSQSVWIGNPVSVEVANFALRKHTQSGK